jgi:hypothetical protein
MGTFDTFITGMTSEPISDAAAFESDLMDAALESIFSRSKEKKATKAALYEEFANPNAVVRYLADSKHIANGFELAKGGPAENRVQELLNVYVKNPGKGKLKTSSEMKKISGYPVIVSRDINGKVKVYSFVLTKDGRQVDDVLTLNSYYKLKERNGDLPHVTPVAGTEE